MLSTILVMVVIGAAVCAIVISMYEIRLRH
jgi:hypothetical protein